MYFVFLNFKIHDQFTQNDLHCKPHFFNCVYYFSCFSLRHGLWVLLELPHPGGSRTFKRSMTGAEVGDI